MPFARTLAYARSHPWATAGLKGLVLLTVLAALPFDPEGPYDARTYERAEGFCLEFPIAGALVEPLAAAGHAMAGAPDMRVAAISALVWVFAVAAAVKLFQQLRRPPCGAWWGAALRALAAGGAAAGVFLVYVAFVLAVRLPSWRLVSESPDFLIAELQTHTFGSHDGLVGARENLEWHRERGFDVVAVTEHNDATGSFEAEKLAVFFSDDLPAVIPGVEIRSRKGAYLLALGLDPGRGSARGPDDGGLTPLKGREDLFCEAVHDLHGGAVLALAWKLGPEDVRRLAAAGVDGFEIANAGHPDVPAETRRAMLDAARERGLVLVSSSDWHGWTGFWRTWTAVRVVTDGMDGTGAGGAADLPSRERVRAVVAALRERRAGDIVPIVAGYMGPPSAARAILSPLVETLRYASELSAVRVAAWWIWAGLVAAAAAGLRRAGLRPGRALLGLLLLVLASGLVWRGGALMWAKAEGETSTAFPGEVGLQAVAIGLAALAGAVVLAVAEVLRVKALREVDEDDEGGASPEDDTCAEEPTS